MSNVATQIQAQLGVEDALFRKNSNNASWAELANGIEIKVRDQIAGSANLAEQVRLTVEAAGVSNPEFDVFYNGVMRDLKIYSQRWSALASRRDGRTDVIKNADEYTEYVSLGIELVSLSEEMAVVVPDTLFNMQEHHHHALEVLRKRQEEQSTDVVTDVDVKEASVEEVAGELPQAEVVEKEAQSQEA